MSVTVRDSCLSGKGLFGTERFAKGDVIITETPLAVICGREPDRRPPALHSRGLGISPRWSH